MGGQMTQMHEAGEVAKHGGLKRAFSTLLAGVASVLPVLATLWLLVLVYKILGQAGDSIIESLFRFLNQLRGVAHDSKDAWAFRFPGSSLVQALLPVAVVFGIGFAVTNSLGRYLLNWVEDRISKLPVIGFVYGSVKQLVDAVKGIGAERNFKGVAYVEYPSPGCRLVGFITGSYVDPKSGVSYTAVFLPTAPNPLTGFVVLIEDARIIPCDMSLEAAMKLVISAGLVAPTPGAGQVPEAAAKLRPVEADGGGSVSGV